MPRNEVFDPPYAGTDTRVYFHVIHGFYRIPMRTLSAVCSTAVFFLLVCGPLSSPVAAQVQPEVTGNFSVAVPQGAFSDNVGRAGIGGTVMAGLRFSGTPAVVGLDLGFMNYGIERRTEPFSTTIPDVRVNVRTSNDILLSHLVLRLQPDDGSIRPHVDGLFGFKYLFTSTRIEDRGSAGREPIASSTNFDDFALSFGGGAGVDIRLAQPSPSADGSVSVRGVYLNLGVRYLFGEEAEYLRRGSIERTNGDLTFDVRRSRTDMLTFGLGVSLKF